MKPYRFVFNKRKYEVRESLIDYRTAKIYVLDRNNNIVGEITDDDKKYKLLQIARSFIYDPFYKL